jgi:hypothetical protein
MPGIVALVSAISDAVNEALTAANYPSLVNGKILLGDQHVFEQSAPPRIIFTPTSSSFGPVNPASTWTAASFSERQRELIQQPVASEDITFEVRCWGASFDEGSDMSDASYDQTQALYQAVIFSSDKIARGVYQLDGGKWTDTTHINKLGREFVFNLTFSTPILDHLLPYAPSGDLSIEHSGILETKGLTEEGC